MNPHYMYYKGEWVETQAVKIDRFMPFDKGDQAIIAGNVFIVLKMVYRFGGHYVYLIHDRAAPFGF